MSCFTETLIVSPLSDGKRWVLRRAFFYDVGKEGSGERIAVPAGFVTDFASVPRLFWRVFPKWGRYGNAAVIHDYLYWEQLYTRRMSDLIFYEAMRVLKTGWLTSKVLYLMVRLFGFVSWFRNRWRKKKGVRRFCYLKGRVEISELDSCDI